MTEGAAGTDATVTGGAPVPEAERDERGVADPTGATAGGAAGGVGSAGAVDGRAPDAAGAPDGTSVADVDGDGARRSGGAWRAAAGLVGGVFVFVAVYLWDDLLLAAPILWMSQVLGEWTAFVFFSVLYGVASWVLAMLAVRAYDRATQGRPSRLARWVEKQSQTKRGAIGARLLATGRAIAFVASSFLIGGLLTTWFIRYSGKREGIERVGALSCAIFGVTFTGFYSGIIHLSLG